MSEVLRPEQDNMLTDLLRQRKFALLVDETTDQECG